MPGFISHTVMARDVYNEINRKCSLEYILTYSLGGDLCKYAKCRYDSHHKDMDKFIYNMADYIKDNNLLDDKEVMGVLYGHICHYIMDSIIHPLVRKMDKECLNNKKNHTLIEEYYDTYLVKIKYGVSKQKYAKERLLNAKMKKKISEMIDYVYMETYNTNKVSKYYKFNLFLYRLLKMIYRLFGNSIVDIILGVNRFIKDNNNIDLFNDNNTVKYKDYLGNRCDDSLIILYNESVLEACEYIKNVDRYLTKN